MLRNVDGAPGGVFQSRTCLLPMITQESSFLLRLHAHYKQGLLPYDGGLLEQPNFYLEAMEILTARESEIAAERLERQKRELARQGLANFPGA